MDNGFCAIEVPFLVHLHGTLLAGCVASLHSDRLLPDPGGLQPQQARKTVRLGIGIPVRFALEQVSDLDWNECPI